MKRRYLILSDKQKSLTLTQLKGNYLRLLMVLSLLLYPAEILFSQGNVGIGTSSPDASAMLEVESTTQGFLMPRMTTAERDLIASPATGLMIYNTTTDLFEYYNGSSWDMVLGGATQAWTLGGNSTVNAWDGTSGTYLGTDNTQPLVLATTNATAQRMEFWTGNELRLRISGNGRIGIADATSPTSLVEIEQPNDDATLSEGYALLVSRDNDGATVAPTQPVVRILQDNTADQHAALTVKQDGVPVPASGIELPSVYAEVNASTSEQAIALWGDAKGGSGTIGVLATGNGGASPNVALQLNDGEFTMGRTTQNPSIGTVVDPADNGTDYSQEGPSGVIELALGGGANLPTVAPTQGVLQDLGTVTIQNSYAKSTSIININVVEKNDDGVNPNPADNSFFIIDVQSRGSGSFVVHIGMIPDETSGANYTASDNIKLGYVIINPGK